MAGTWCQRPGSDPNALTGLAKINLSTGEIMRFDVGRAPGNGAMLATAGDLVFHGDMNRRFRAFDASTGKKLWETVLGGNVSVSTMTYAVNGKQYVAVMTGNNPKVPELNAEVPEIKIQAGLQRHLRLRSPVAGGTGFSLWLAPARHKHLFLRFL